MSAKPKWCFANWSKGDTNIFPLRTCHRCRGYVSLNQTNAVFRENVPKGPRVKVGAHIFMLNRKISGARFLHYYFLPPNLKISKLKKVEKTDPTYFSILHKHRSPSFFLGGGPVLRKWHFLKKTACVWFDDTYPLNQWHVLSGKILVSPLDQFVKHHFGSANMWEGFMQTIMYFYQEHKTILPVT